MDLDSFNREAGNIRPFTEFELRPVAPAAPSAPASRSEVEVPQLLRYTVKMKNAMNGDTGVKVLASRFEADAHWVTFVVDVPRAASESGVRSMPRSVRVAAFAANLVKSITAA